MRHDFDANDDAMATGAAHGTGARAHRPGPTEPGRTEPGRTEQGRTEQGRTEPGRSERDRTERDRTERDPTAADSAETGPAALRRLLAGAALLTGERIPLSRGQPSVALAVMVGFAAQGREAAGRLTQRLGSARPRWAQSPRQQIRQLFDAAARSGTQILDARRAEAATWLTDRVDASMTWAERSLIPKLVDDLMPYLVETVVPQVIDGALPRIRMAVIPEIVEDMSTDPRVRAMVAEQSRSVATAAAQELRDATATADDRVESSLRRVFGHASDP